MTPTPGKKKIFERFNSTDIVQTAVGSLAGAMIYSYQTDIPRLADSLPLFNMALIVLVTLLLSALVGYGIGVRRLGRKKMRLLLGVVPLRIISHYSLAVCFSALILWLLAINLPSTQFGFAVRRVIVLSLPATLLGSTVDLVGSQKND